MKPMKVMRYGSRYRYGASQPKNKTIIITVIACVIVAALTVLAIVRFSSLRQQDKDNGALSLQMREGQASQMEVKTGDICMLSMPSAIDIK